MDHADTSRIAPHSSLLKYGVRQAPGTGTEVFICQNPLPPLPRNLPEMAMYFQGILDTPRKSSDPMGVRRLSKLVEKYYPASNGADADSGERSSRISGMFSKVMNRKGDRRRGGAGANADSYDLVTPFRLDS